MVRASRSAEHASVASTVAWSTATPPCAALVLRNDTAALDKASGRSVRCPNSTRGGSASGYGITVYGGGCVCMCGHVEGGTGAEEGVVGGRR